MSRFSQLRERRHRASQVRGLETSKVMKQTTWKKLGLLYCSGGDASWRISHASCPLAQHLEGDLFRVWYAPRDKNNRTYSAWFEFNITRPNDVIRHAPAPSI